MPLDLTDLAAPEGVAETKLALKRLVDGAKRTIDLTAVYWSLLLNPEEADLDGLPPSRLLELGAEYGRALYQALENAARRGVQIRILQSPGFNEEEPQQSAQLATDFPDQVHIRQVDMTDWYGGGIMHHKSWIVDGRSLYIGSANIDWRSLTQVKELGVIVENQPAIAADATRQFETWWQFATLEPQTTEIFDAVVQMTRPVPCWSDSIAENGRCPSPLPVTSARGLDNPLALAVNGEMGTAVLTASPPELTNDGRTDDLAGLLHTIRTTERSICLSVMIFAPTSKLDEQLFWWPQLTDALLQAVINRGVDVRFLLGWWDYTYPSTGPFLQALLDTAAALQLDKEEEEGEEAEKGPNGSLQIKRFLIPGWDSVEGEERRYPGHSRVNHAKFIVTDNRLNVGTSNMTWGYFHQTIGGSFNTDHPALIRQAQAIFDRDWESVYARELE
jgi:phospholipase D3/4